MKCGLLGRKLGHSYSAQIHALLGNYDYSYFEIEPEDLDAFFAQNTLSGFNVTIPYKKDVIPYCHELTPQAQIIGAVNTIVRHQDGHLIGHNTDYFGFASMLDRTKLSVSGKKVLVLGSGGASVTAVCVLKELGANVITISRSGKYNYDNIHEHNDASVIVNATPVGMFPNNGVSPVNLDLFPQLEGVLDMIYNPSHTALLQQAEKKNIVAENGLWMLVAQAKEAAQWFTGQPLPDRMITSVHIKLQSQMENLILIGMPGSGKSTIGTMLADRLNRTFADSDSAITEKAGIPIPQIFNESGEAGFRRLETESLDALGRSSGLVIATGGGCVTRAENYPLLHQNSKIIWLKRNVDSLPTAGRPLSQTQNLADMYAKRAPLYDAFSDYIVDNNGSPEETINQIISLLQLEA